ncbi:uncharacterized protein LOC118437836 [Folsomia candida]|uniref:uncharacterized protein LOC118437836 n=1 Tax=Folsomia candida TaxID=158441 RepID=UPI001604C947|nr:uncharacterized protein LOC118437836 [Folsomia candida]
MKKIGILILTGLIAIFSTVLQESRQQLPVEIWEAGFRNFISDVISNFPQWINANELDPTPPGSRTYPINLNTGPVSLTGYFSNVSVIGLSTIYNHTFDNSAAYGTSYEGLHIGMYIWLRHGGIQGK